MSYDFKKQTSEQFNSPLTFEAWGHYDHIRNLSVYLYHLLCNQLLDN